MFGGLKQDILDSGSSDVEKILIFRVTILKKGEFFIPPSSILMPNATVAEDNCGLIPQIISEEACYRLITALSQAMEIN